MLISVGAESDLGPGSVGGTVLLNPKFCMLLFLERSTGRIGNGLAMVLSTIRLHLGMPMILVCRRLRK